MFDIWYSIFQVLPRRFLNSRYHALIGVFSETNAAESEIAHKRALATATETAPHDAGTEFRLL